MPYVAIISVIAIAQYYWLGFQVGRARTQYGIHAPATSGHEMFDRRFRVHMNTLEQLVVFLPSLWMFASFVSPIWAAALGAVFIVGRALYALTYMRNPRSRAAGFGLTAFPMFAMWIGIVVWAVRAIASGASS